MDPITLTYGADEPLVLECLDGVRPVVFEPPAGESGGAAGRMVTAAIAAPPHGPPLSAHVVPGDRVVVALAGAVPQAAAVVAAVTEQLVAARVEPGDITVIEGPPLGPSAGGTESVAEPPPGSQAFDPGNESATAYLAADEAGRPLYLARQLVDADVVVAVGGWGWNAAFAGRSLEGELWPTFSRAACRHDLAVALARRGRNALPDWRSSMQEIVWQLGVCASLRLVAGRSGTLVAACFGLPDEAGRRARAAAAAWCPLVERPVDLSIATLSDPYGGFGRLLAAVAAAARATRPGGTICVASRTAAEPGIIFQRWRQGAPLEGLVHEAVASGDQALVVDALLTRLFARALDDRRLVLLSNLGEDTVEELEFGYAASPEVVERLAHRAESLAVLPEADLALPQSPR
ncbi:MAG: hypothetical protein ACKOC8_00415 [Pirellulales bacterium]